MPIIAQSKKKTKIRANFLNVAIWGKRKNSPTIRVWTS